MCCALVSSHSRAVGALAHLLRITRWLALVRGDNDALDVGDDGSATAALADVVRACLVRACLVTAALSASQCLRALRARPGDPVLDDDEWWDGPT